MEDKLYDTYVSKACLQVNKERLRLHGVCVLLNINHE